MTDTTNLGLDKPQLRELLPFHANQTLDATQTAQVQSGLQRYPELQAELAWLQTMRNTVQEQPLDPLPAGDLGWSTLARRIESERAQKARPATRAEPGWQDKLRAWLQLNFTSVMATACAVLVIQGVVIGSLLQRDETYIPAGAPDPVAATATGVLLHIAIRPTVTEPQLREALRRFKANIVQGPTALGIYTVQIEPSGDVGVVPLDATQLSQRLLSEAGSVFESVTPAAGR